MKQLLAVCHSVGEANAIYSVANELSQREVKTHILATGSDALNCLNTKSLDNVSLLSLDELLPEDQPIKQKTLALSDSSLATLTNKLQDYDFDGILVGSPSYQQVHQQSKINAQLLSHFAQDLPSAVLSDYLFHDPQHTLAVQRWDKAADKVLMPMQKALDRLQVANDKGVVVGHQSLDDIQQKYQNWLNDPKAYQAVQEEVYQKLNLGQGQAFVFVAAGKSMDEDMIKALASVAPRFEDLKVVIGVHPAAPDEYLATLQAIIDNNQAQNSIRLLPKRHVDTDQAVSLANAVLTVSSTVGTTAASVGKLAGFYQQGKQNDDESLPFSIADMGAHLISNQDQLLTFFEQARQQNPSLQQQAAGSKSFKAKAADQVELLLNSKSEKKAVAGSFK